MTLPTSPPDLYWLPAPVAFSAAVAALRAAPDPDTARMLANQRLDFLQTRTLDRAVQGLPDMGWTGELTLAVLGSGTLEHLLPAIRVAGLRRGLRVRCWQAPYGQWRQQILDPAADLHRLRPDVILLAVDPAELLPDLPLSVPAEEADAALAARAEEMVGLWRTARERTGAVILHQLMPLAEPPAFGHFERLVPAAPGALAARLDEALVRAAARDRVLLLDLGRSLAEIGRRHVGDARLWHHAKQAISPAAAPWYGEQVGRVLASLRGLSRKVLVLDLDNTLWGGVIGDDGLGGIVLGQGSAAGEAFAAFQRHVRQLSRRGVILAVSSKNSPEVAEAVFREHPDMVLTRSDIAAFEANWEDKPAALRRIARDLELGIDSLVFFDDNPVERDLMRRSLPAVAVPEVPDAPELYVQTLADAGYFEPVAFTADDAGRTRQYQANAERRQGQATATDMDSFLSDLDMVLEVEPVTPVNLTRVTQLINKTNQFNLTTRRYTEPEVRDLRDSPDVLTFAARLKDRFGDNGIIAIVIGRLVEHGRTLDLDSWLMSCRVLGRGVEQALLSVVAAAAARRGVTRLVGRYRPTARNGMVRDFYPGLGFTALPASAEDQCWSLDLGTAVLPQPRHFTLALSV